MSGNGGGGIVGIAQVDQPATGLFRLFSQAVHIKRACRSQRSLNDAMARELGQLRSGLIRRPRRDERDGWRSERIDGGVKNLAGTGAHKDLFCTESLTCSEGTIERREFLIVIPVRFVDGAGHHLDGLFWRPLGKLVSIEPDCVGRRGPGDGRTLRERGLSQAGRDHCCESTTTKHKTLLSSILSTGISGDGRTGTQCTMLTRLCTISSCEYSTFSRDQSLNFDAEALRGFLYYIAGVAVC